MLIIHAHLLLPPTSLVFNMGKAHLFKAHCHHPLLSPVPPHSCLMCLRLFVILLVTRPSSLVRPRSCLTCLRLFVVLPVAHPSSLMFNTFEAHCHHPPLSPTVVTHLHHPPLSPTFVTHCCHPPLLPTVVAHCHHPPLLPTVRHHHPPSSPMGHLCCPPSLPTMAHASWLRHWTHHDVLSRPNQVHHLL